MAQKVERRTLNSHELDAEIDPVLERIYRAREIRSIEEVDTKITGLLHYERLKGIKCATHSLADAIEKQIQITIIGDFDADGATSTALCMLGLKALGATKIDYLVPNRFDFGYGLSPEIVDIAHQQGTELIVTVDSGIACHQGVERAKAFGMQVIITDHHLPSETLPNATAIVNPNQYGCEFESKMLAGVGVAFYLLSSLRAELSRRNWFENNDISAPSMAQWLDIVAVGTVADVVPLDKNNRVLVQQGLNRIRSGRCRPGIQAMIDIANRQSTNLAASDLGFVIGPRLNAAGRLEDMSLGIECLLCDDVFRARQLAAQLDELNQTRRRIEADMRSQAELNIQKLLDQTSESSLLGITAFDEDYHQGVIGIVAGRIREKFNRPTVIFASQDDHIVKGSARSVSGVHIRDVFARIETEHPNLIIKYGGHAMAAGLSIYKKDLDLFSTIFNQVLENHRVLIESEPVLYSDGELDKTHLSLNFAKMLKQAGPFGQGFPAPMFDGEFRIQTQRLLAEKHLKVSLITKEGDQVDGIAFNVNTEQWPDPQVDNVRLVYSLDVNVFRQQTSLQLIIESLIPC